MTSRYLSLVALFLLFAAWLAAPPAARAQLELDENGDVAIGTPDFSAKHKVSIRSPDGSYGARALFVDVTGSGDGDAIAIFGRSVPSDGNGTGARFEGGGTGLKATANSPFNPGEQYSNRVGIRAGAGGGADNRAIRLSSRAGGYAEARNTGLFGEIGGGRSAQGILLRVGDTYHTSPAGESNTGLKVQIGGTAGSTDRGIVVDNQGNGLDYAGYFEGDVHITGSLSGVSDRKFKTDIRGLGAGLSGEVAERVQANAEEALASAASTESRRSATRAKLLRLAPKRFRFKRAEYEEMGLPAGEQLGLIAQEVAEVFPALVEEVSVPAEETLGDDGQVVERTPATSYLSVNYLQLIPILVQTVKEQQAEIDLLKAALKEQGIAVE